MVLTVRSFEKRFQWLWRDLHGRQRLFEFHFEFFREYLCIMRIAPSFIRSFVRCLLKFFHDNYSTNAWRFWLLKTFVYITDPLTFLSNCDPLRGRLNERKPFNKIHAFGTCKQSKKHSKLLSSVSWSGRAWRGPREQIFCYFSSKLIRSSFRTLFRGKMCDTR